MTTAVCETSERESASETFKINVIVLGNIARAYAQTPGPSIQRNWGAGIGSAQVRDGDTLYTVGTGRKDGKVCVQITARKDDGTRVTYFIPREALDLIEFTVPVL